MGVVSLIRYLRPPIQPEKCGLKLKDGLKMKGYLH